MKTSECIFRLSALLIAAVALAGSVACSTGGGRAMPLLETADSIMATDPQAAYHILCSIEEGADVRMNRQERACFLLLMAEADYRCDEPMVRDTAVGGGCGIFSEEWAERVVCQGPYHASCGAAGDGGHPAGRTGLVEFGPL